MTSTIASMVILTAGAKLGMQQANILALPIFIGEVENAAVGEPGSE